MQCERVVDKCWTPAEPGCSRWTHRRLKPQLQLPSHICRHIYPDRCEQKTQRNVTVALFFFCFFLVTWTALACRNEEAFAHYANRIDGTSNAFIRLITPKVKSVCGKVSAAILTEGCKAFG